MRSHLACAVCVVWESGVDFKYSTLVNTFPHFHGLFPFGLQVSLLTEALSCLIFSGEAGDQLL